MNEGKEEKEDKNESGTKREGEVRHTQIRGGSVSCGQVRERFIHHPSPSLATCHTITTYCVRVRGLETYTCDAFSNSLTKRARGRLLPFPKTSHVRSLFRHVKVRALVCST